MLQHYHDGEGIRNGVMSKKKKIKRRGARNYVPHWLMMEWNGLIHFQCTSSHK